ncbi:TRAP transporter large permease [Desertibaculum subflavum]|uniref:TRAP transporter large permease n=1 Tax=Desertibaculum subflavum TaxID=2268458 RepID=UPI000E670CA9
MEPIEIGTIGALSLVVLAALGVRIFIAAGVVGTIGLVAMIGPTAGLQAAGTVPHAKSASYTLSVLPMFIIIGYLAYYARITQSCFEAARRWLGWLPGGLAIGTVFAVAAFSAVSGASTAAAAVFARVAIPEMLKNGYNRRLAAGVVAAGATLDSLIPPSGLLVIYGIIVEESIGKLLIAGFVPGFISALVYTAIIIFRCKLDPTLGPPVGGYSWRQRLESLPGTFPVWLVIGLIFSAMYYGWATPTEAGALGAFSVLVIALWYGMSWGDLKKALADTAKLTVMIFTVIWGVLIFVLFLGYAQLPETIAQWVTDQALPPIVILLLIYLIYFILGCFMDAIGMLLLTLPIVFPVIVNMGYDPIWFGIIVVKLCGICLLTPPVGLCCYVVNGVRPDIPLGDVFRGIWPFVVADVITISILTAYPGLVTFIID